MREKNAFYLIAAFFVLLCNNSKIICKEIDIPGEAEQLRLFLLKGYESAKSVLEDVRIEYERKRDLLLDSVSYKELFGRDPYSSPYTSIEEYIQKNDKERWAFLYTGTSTAKEDISSRAELIGTENSPRFRIFNGQYILDYYPTKKDGMTSVGRATLDISKTSLFESSGPTVYAPIEFFGYYPGLMPDDILSSPQLKIETKPEKIDNLLTYEVSAHIQINKTKYNVVYWLAPERLCLPVKIEVERNSKFSRRLEVKEFVELEDGRWAIKSIIQRNFVTKEGEETPIELVSFTYTMRKLELHPDIDEDKIFSTSPDSLPKGVHIIDKRSGNSPGYINYPAPPSLIGEVLPDFNNLKVDFSPEQAKDKKILVCFWDMNQRPSRNCLLQLSKRAQELKAKDIVVVAVQASKVDENTLNEWVRKYNITFPIGIVQGDDEKARFNWGVKSLPWLILTDREHIVTAEGFGLNELNDKIENGK